MVDADKQQKNISLHYAKFKSLEYIMMSNRKLPGEFFLNNIVHGIQKSHMLSVSLPLTLNKAAFKTSSVNHQPSQFSKTKSD